MKTFLYCIGTTHRLECLTSKISMGWWILATSIVIAMISIAFLRKRRISFQDECRANKTARILDSSKIRYPDYVVVRSGILNLWGSKTGLRIKLPPSVLIEDFLRFRKKYEDIFKMDLAAPVSEKKGWYFFPRSDFISSKKK